MATVRTKKTMVKVLKQEGADPWAILEWLTVQVPDKTWMSLIKANRDNKWKGNHN
jgi:Tfp pilus assembly protein PilN